VVLWQYDESGWHYPVVVPQVSETRAECEKSREELVNDWQTRGYNARSACLPDSVDPRAPKGGGR